MKTYTLSFGASIGHKPAHPERSAYRVHANGFDVVVGVWSNRKALETTLEMQSRRPPGGKGRWTPYVPPAWWRP